MKQVVNYKLSKYAENKFKNTWNRYGIPYTTSFEPESVEFAIIMIFIVQKTI